MPDSFSLVEETVVNGMRTASTTKLFYSYGGQVARFDVIKLRKNSFQLSKFKIIHDFNSGQ